jgi:hypothetical protein
VQPAQTSVPVPDEVANGILTTGVHLPPPRDAPAVFVTTHPTELLDQVVQDLLQAGILQENNSIVNAFRLFLVAKASGAARPVFDLSPWTPFYQTPPMRLYSAAEVLVALPQNAQLIKVDLKSGFFQIPICTEYLHHYGIYYRKRRLIWTRLPMGHPLAPAVMQRVATAAARYIHQCTGAHMVAYLNDWLIFGHDLPVPQILNAIQRLGFQINYQKSSLIPATALVYLGLNISSAQLTITPTESCI